MSTKPLSPAGSKTTSELWTDAAFVDPQTASKELRQPVAQDAFEAVTGQSLIEPSGTVTGALAALNSSKQPSAATTAVAKKGRTVTVHSAAMPTLMGQPALRFMKIEGAERLSELYEYRLELRTADDTTVPLAVSANIDASVLIGKEMTVAIELSGSGTGFGSGLGAGEREISGLVVAAGFSRREGRFHVYEIILRPWFWLATLTTDFKIFQDKSVIDIVDDVLADYPYPVEKRLDAGKYGVAGESARNEPRAFQVQYGETDFDFLQRLMEEWGIYWFFEHSDGKHRLVLCDHVGAHKSSPSAAYQMLAYRPQSGRIDSEYVREFTLSEGLRPGRVVLSDYDFTRPIADLKAVSQQPLEHSPADAEIYLWPGDYTDSKHADLISRVRMEEQRTAGARARGAGNVRGLACGQTFVLGGHTHSAANREYLMIESKVACVEIGEESGSGYLYEFENAFLVQPTTEVFRPPRVTRKPRTHGPQSALVVGPSGQEIWTDQYGRVKVQFHWDRYGTKDENSSCWVRVSSPWAGSGFGGMQIPRVGQEVIVDFENGDPDRPIITGRVYNAQSMPPWALPANATQSGFLSRSSHGGSPANANAIRFEDKAGSEELWIHAEKDQRIEVENDESHSVDHDRTKTIGNNETSLIKNNRTETVNGDEVVTIQKCRTETVVRDENITVHQSRTERVDLNEMISIGVDRTEDVGANEVVTIGGNKAETVAIAKAETIGAAKALTIGGAYQVSVGAVMNTTVGLMQSEEIGLSQSSVIGKNHTMVVGSNQTFTVTKDQMFKVGQSTGITAAKNISLHAGDFIELVCGKSKIRMDKNGNIAINGHKINVRANGTIDIKGQKVDLNK